MKDNAFYETEFVEKEISVVLEQGYKEAETLLKNEDNLELFLQRLEKKLKTIPKIGGKLAEVPVMASLLKSYIQKEYTDIPLGTIIAIISALLYFVSPIDLIPDSIPGVGHLDDAFMIAACMRLVEDDLREYLDWRKNTGRELFT